MPKNYFPGNVITPVADMTFYAIWNEVTGRLSANPSTCVLSAGATSCNTTLSWETFNSYTPTGTSTVTSNMDNSGGISPNFIVATSNNGSKEDVYIPNSPAGRDFYLYTIR